MPTDQGEMTLDDIKSPVRQIIADENTCTLRRSPRTPRGSTPTRVGVARAVSSSLLSSPKRTPIANTPAKHTTLQRSASKLLSKGTPH